MTPARAVAATALAAYVAGWAIGTVAAWAAWVTTSHEHRYRITGRTPA